MSLPKALSLIALATFSVFLYAHEQVSKTIFLYDIQHHQKEKGMLQDAHRLLKYQVSKLSSPSMLETTLAKGDLYLDLPEDREVIHLALHKPRAPFTKQKKSLLDFLSVTKVAEAGSR